SYGEVMELRDASSRPASLAVPRPRHIGVIMDGNRRWAKAQRHVDVGFGHKAGAEHLVPRQVVGRISGSGQLGTVGSASPRWTCDGRFQASASWGRMVLNSAR